MVVGRVVGGRRAADFMNIGVSNAFDIVSHNMGKLTKNDIYKRSIRLSENWLNSQG